MAYSRVEEPIEQIHEQVDDHHAGGKDQVDAGDHGVISVDERIQQQPPEPRQIEDVLHYYGSADQDGELQADQGHHRNEGIFDDVSHDNHPLLEPLGPGRSHVVLPEHLQHHGAGHTHGRGGEVGAQNQTGHDEHAEIAQQVIGEGNHPNRRGPVPPDRRKDNNQQTQPEVGRRQSDDGQGTPSVVGERVTADRRVDAHRQRDDEPDGDCQEAKLKGDRQPAENLLLDRDGAAKQRLPERAVQHYAADPARVLHVHRHIEAEKALELCASVNSSAPIGAPKHRVDDIARDEPDE